MSTLSKLARKANRHHHAAQKAWRAALDHALQAGIALVRAKNLVRHGEWDEWLAEHFEASPRTARVYMRIARTYHLPKMVEARKGLEIKSISAFLALLKADKSATTEADAQKQESMRQFSDWLDGLDPHERQYVADHFDKISSRIDRHLQKQRIPARSVGRPVGQIAIRNTHHL